MPEIRYGEQSIPFDLTFAERRTLEISVWPDGRVVVKAPHGKAPDLVATRVQKRARWILRQQAYFRQLDEAQPEKEYVSGESFRYLGKQYRLKVFEMEKSTPSAESAKLVGGYLQVRTSDKDDRSRVKGLVDKWYRQHAQRKFAERLRLCSDIMRKHGVENPALEIRRMQKRWGSCTPRGTILLNPRLVEFPVYCIDYVILHEMCHLLHPDHSKAFYRLLESVLPEWQAIRERLNFNH